MLLKDKTALVTGASSGIGAAIAKAFAAEGAFVIINYLKNKSGAESTLAAVRKWSDGMIMQADLTSEEQVAAMFRQIEKDGTSLDILVNNVGAYFAGDEWNMDNAAWEQTFKTNVLAALSVSKHAAEQFVKNKKGVMVNIASVRGNKPRPTAIAYGASKAGVISLTQSYAKLLAPFGRANSISPGIVNAGYWLTAPAKELKEEQKNIPMQKLVQPEDVANLVVFLASDQSAMITGQNIAVDGGYLLN